mmetsp:Transcript_11809/g.32339  ORF Transcript_11809/g.32339 Transcript_11809/m.32339 type:complete len:104 (-) Transcript_11809:26-337(-)
MANASRCELSQCAPEPNTGESMGTYVLQRAGSMTMRIDHAQNQSPHIGRYLKLASMPLGGDVARQKRSFATSQLFPEGWGLEARAMAERGPSRSDTEAGALVA